MTRTAVACTRSARAERAREEIDDDVTRTPRHHGGAEEHEPDEGEAGHLFRPAQRIVEDIAAEDLEERDNNGGDHQHGGGDFDGEIDRIGNAGRHRRADDRQRVRGSGLRAHGFVPTIAQADI
jgi:hypothetical protein